MGDSIHGAVSRTRIAANYADTGINTTSAVGCFPGGASPYMIEDLSGNVLEWTRSLWEKYPYPTDEKAQAQRENLDAGSDVARVWRGGAFDDLRRHVRCAYRDGLDPDYSAQAHRISGGGAPMSLTSDPLPSVALVSGGVQRGAPLWSFFAPLIRS